MAPSSDNKKEFFPMKIKLWKKLIIKSKYEQKHTFHMAGSCVCELLSRVQLCNPMDYSPPGSSIQRILQASIMEWVAILFFRVCSPPRDWTQVSHIAGRFFTIWATRHLIKATGMEYRFAAEWGGLYRSEHSHVWQPNLAEGWESEEARPGPPSVFPPPQNQQHIQLNW